MGTDGIFLITRENEMVEMTAAPFINEDDLQDLLARYPNLLPGGQINPSAPRRWLLIAREVGVPGVEGGNNRWSLDHLFVDQDAVPTIVEVKRSSDTRIRREVVGQMLDYAANGVRYWPVEQLRAQLVARVGGLDEADAAVLELVGDGDVEAFWAAAEDNLRTGKVRMIFVADRIPAELQRIVEFLNEQMSTAEVLALEIGQYTADRDRTLVPRLIGRTSVAQQVKRQVAPASFDDLLAQAAPEVREFDRRLVVWAAENGWTMEVSRGIRKMFHPRGAYGFAFYPGWEKVQVSLGRFSADEAPLAQELRQRLEKIAERPVSERSPLAPVKAVLRHWDEFFGDFLSDYMAAVASTNDTAAGMSEAPLGG